MAPTNGRPWVHKVPGGKFILCLYFGPVSKIPKLIHYRVVFVPIPEQRLGRSLDSFPLILVYYFPVQ